MLKQLRPALMSVLVLTILTGLLFPGVATGLAQVMFPKQAHGSLLEENGKVVGSALMGQPFSAPGYFHPRPSAAGNGYNAGKPDDAYTGSSGTNLGPTSSKLIKGIEDDPKTKDTDESYSGIPQLVKAYREENGLAADAKVPADAVTRSASGLDPHISPENAALQVARVAKARGLSEDAVRALVAQNTEGRTLGVIGDARMNVLNLNRALDKAKQMASVSRRP
jgi:K+-transporting ATPase ATPase C chain